MCETKMLCHLDTVWGNSPIYLESQKVFPVLLLAWNVFASLCKTTCTLEGRFTFICSTSRTVSVLIENLNGRGGRTSRICDIMSSKANPGPRFSIHKCLLLNWKICREKPVVNSQHNVCCGYAALTFLSLTILHLSKLKSPALYWYVVGRRSSSWFAAQNKIISTLP